MASSSANEVNKSSRRKPRTDTSPQSRENEMIALAMDRVEERMRNGQASSAEYVHFLRLGTERAKLEREKLEYENKLIAAKTESIQQQGELKELFENAINAIHRYQGNPIDEDDDYE